MSAESTRAPGELSLRFGDEAHFWSEGGLFTDAQTQPRIRKKGSPYQGTAEVNSQRMETAHTTIPTPMTQNFVSRVMPLPQSLGFNGLIVWGWKI